MIAPFVSVQPRTKVPGTWRTPGKGPHDDLELRVGYGLSHMQVTAAKTGRIYLREFRITEVEDGWLAMVKGDRGKKALVAYFFAETYRGALVSAITSLDTGTAPYRADSYPPRRYLPDPGRLVF